VPAHDRRTVPETPGKLRRRGRTTVEERARHALGTGAGEFHTPIVSQMPIGATPGPSWGPSWIPLWGHGGPGVPVAERSPLRETALVDAARLAGVTVSYPGGRRALDGMDLRVGSARVTALLGPNGAGKSTSVGVLAGLIPANAGQVEVLGGAPGRPEARRRVNVMVQDDGLPTGAYAAETVRHVARLRQAPATAERLIGLLGLDALGRTTIRRLSGGERRRVSLACALVGDPDVVILDEPTAGLDPRGRALVWDLVADLRERGRAVLLCTHLLDEAEALGDDIAIIAEGRCIAQGPLSALLPDSSEVVSFDGPLHLELEGLLRALPEGARVTETSPGRYRVEGGATPQVLATVASWCGQHGVQPRNLGVGAETLADLYWRLTSEPGGTP
jgi:ABC-2 type transport system ATP-binding protein